jgi:hypothetical protein
MDRATKRALLRACKVDEPVPPEDPRHFDFDRPDLHLRGQPWKDRAFEVIDLASEPTTQILTGLPGSGKTTELRQLETDLKRRRYNVVFADAGAWIRDDAPITTQQVLLALVLALYPTGRPGEARGWLQDYRDRVAAFFTSQVRVSELGLSAGVADLTVELTTNDTLFQKVARHLTSLQGLREQVFRLLEVAARGAREAGETLVLLLDGIEKRATGDLAGPEEREKFRNHWFGAFLTNARDLRPPLHVVYTVPPFMIRRAAELGNQFGHELLFLPMVRVLDSGLGPAGEPRIHVPGVCAMRDALFRRVGEEYFTDCVVPAWLALQSGGYMRDLLRLVIECIYRCPEGGRIDRDLAEAALAQVRQTYLEGLEKQDEALLQQVHREREFPLDEDNEQRMDTLLQSYLMLRYHNARSWYDAHPLLWPRLDVSAPTWEEIGALCP